MSKDFTAEHDGETYSGVVLDEVGLTDSEQPSAEEAAKAMRRAQILDDTTDSIKETAHITLAGTAMFTEEAVGRSLEELNKFFFVRSLSASSEAHSMSAHGESVPQLSRLMSLQHLPVAYDAIEMYGYRYPDAGWQHGKVSWKVDFTKSDVQLVTKDRTPAGLWTIEVDTWWELDTDEVTK